MIELRQNFDDPIVYSTDNIDLSYLNIPVLTKFNINSNVNFVVGPQIGFLVMAKSDNLGDVKQLYNTVDFGFDFGGGVSFDDLIIDLRYNMGLSDVPLNKILVYGSGTSSKNSVFQLSLGYKF